MDYKVLFSSDDYCYHGYGPVARDPAIPHRVDENGKATVRLNQPARKATVLCPIDQ